jgi:hypothetical protein
LKKIQVISGNVATILRIMFITGSPTLFLREERGGEREAEMGGEVRGEGSDGEKGGERREGRGQKRRVERE